MVDKNTRLKYLFNRYYHKCATSQEVEELFSTLDIDRDKAEAEELLQHEWNMLEPEHPFFTTEKSEELFRNIMNRANGDTLPTENSSKSSVINLWIKIGFAAAALIVIGVGALQVLKPRQNNPKPQIVKAQVHDALPGTNKAVLKLADGTSVVLDDAKKGVIATQGDAQVAKRNNGLLVYHALANNLKPVFNTISTPRGGQYQIVLPDGTKVWLNAASSLRFPSSFTGNTREVEITGEAYFEVTKNKHFPFVVKSKDTDVQVLGTHFDVMAYDDEPDMKTTLLEGMIKITGKDFKEVLKPGDQAITNSEGKGEVYHHVNTDTQVAWKNGLFEFDDVSLAVIMRQVSRWYDLDIRYQGSIPEKQFTGTLSRNVKASELLTMLKYVGLKCQIDGKQLTILN